MGPVLALVYFLTNKNIAYLLIKKNTAYLTQKYFAYM